LRKTLKKNNIVKYRERERRGSNLIFVELFELSNTLDTFLNELSEISGTHAGNGQQIRRVG
jgi:hypothetical protein